MKRRHQRDVFVAAAIALVTAVFVAAPSLEGLSGMSIDVLTAMRWEFFGSAQPAPSSPTVVVALDEETYRTPPFVGTPNVTWIGEIGRVLTAVVEGGAIVVGFDIVFPTSIEQSEIPFGHETLGEKVRGFDREFLRALALASRSDKVVLGEIQHQDHPILPSPGQRAAVGQLRNIRALNAYTDSDGIVRRLPLSFIIDGATAPSMAVELAARAGGMVPTYSPNGDLTLGEYKVPAAVANTITLNFEGGADDIPTYSLADLRACVEKRDADFFRRHFGGKVVLIGTVLDTEDRKLSSKRFATAPEGARAARCALAVAPAAGRYARDSIAGVYLHATAVNNLINRDALVELGFASRLALTVALAALTAAVVLAVGPINAALVCLGLAAAWIAGAVFIFRHAVVVPLSEPLIAEFLTLATTIGYRFIVSDRDRRLLRQSFGFYLAPQVVEKLMASNKPPVLGGELRQITIFFSDIAGFSSIAETMAPRELVALMNEYFREMTDIVEAHDGFVDKYIGDAIVAVFGAPLDDNDHAAKAVRAALACQARLAELSDDAIAFSARRLSTRIGLNSGEALVGNIGSHRHFSYTVMGDAVNVAARLEDANRHFGSAIMASEDTATLTLRLFDWRELDSIRVKGRDRPVRVFEPLGGAGQQSAALMARMIIYGEGLACWRVRDFAGAAQHFKRIAPDDPPALHFLTRTEQFLKQPPSAEWQPITTF
jgi:adenylate cyclase